MLAWWTFIWLFLCFLPFLEELPCVVLSHSWTCCFLLSLLDLFFLLDPFFLFVLNSACLIYLELLAVVPSGSWFLCQEKEKITYNLFADRWTAVVQAHKKKKKKKKKRERGKKKMREEMREREKNAGDKKVQYASLNLYPCGPSTVYRCPWPL